MLGRRLLTQIVALGLACSLAACGSTTAPDRGATASPAGSGSGLYKVGKPYKIKGVWYYPQIDYDYVEEGVASWYGPGFHGKTTANGEIYDQNDMTAAHRTLPMPSLVRVTNLENGRSIKLRVNDRGPFAQGRIIDLSRRGAQLLGFYNAGTAPVRVEIDGEESRQLAIALTGTDYPGGGSRTLLASRPPPPLQPAYAVSSFEPPPLEALPVGALAVAPVPGSPALPEAEPIGTAGNTWSAEDPAAAPGSVAAPEPSFDIGETPPPLDTLQPLPDEQAPPLANAPAPGLVPATVSPPVIGEVRFHQPARTYVQAGAFSHLGNVEKARLQLARLGPVHVTNIGSAGRDLWRVRVGPLTSPDEAERLVVAVLRSGYPGSHVVVE